MRIRKWWAATAAMVGTLAGLVAILPQPASAMTGCSSMVRGVEWKFASRQAYAYSSSYLQPPTRMGTVYTTLQVYGDYCPNGTRLPKVQITAMRWCWHRPTEHKMFTGVTFNGMVTDDVGGTHAWNPGPIQVPDDNSPKNCRLQFDPNTEWMQFRHHPRAYGHYTVNVDWAPDTHATFTYRRGDALELREGNIHSYGPWHLVRSTM